MNLAEPTKCQAICAKSSLQAAAVFEDVFPGVPFREAKIQDFFAAKIAHASGPGAETVNQPRNLFQRSRLEYAQASGFALGPSL